MNDNTLLKNFDFSQLISEQYNSLTKSEKRIANFLRKNQEESAFLPAGEIARRLNLSEATLVRFARTLGFDSYPAMRTVLQENFRRRVSHSARLRGRLDDLREGGDMFERLTVTEVDYLTQAMESIDRAAIKQAVELMREHQRIFVFGLGPSISLVDLMEIRLRRFGKNVIPLKNSGRELLESILLLEPSDLVFIICFFDQNPALKLLLDYCNRIGCSTIMLTDTLDAIFGDRVNVVLSARRGPIGEFHSLVVPMTVINALLLSVAGEDQEKIMPILDRLDLLRDQMNILNADVD
ncbi:MAG: MurR/RpiR family transcriptional regulator [Anaerolineaceae bacterium]|jgi:DNA-binding MurR/RpiR family transcriptional regulator